MAIAPNRKSLIPAKAAPPENRASLAVDSLWDVSERDPRWLLKLIDGALERDQALWEAPRRYFRASGSGEACSRALTLEAMGHRVPFEARVMRIFRTGNSIEDVNVAAMKSASVFESGQDEVSYDDPPIVGHVDCVLKRPGTGERMLGEIKSIKQELFKMLPVEHGPTLAGESPLRKGMYFRYLKQWNTYAWSPSIDLELGFLLFEAKNDQHQKIYWLLRDPALLDDVLGIRREAAPYVEGDPMRVAPIPAGFNPDDQAKGNACGWCDRRYLCRRLPREGCDYDEARAEDAKVRG